MIDVALLLEAGFGLASVEQWWSSCVIDMMLYSAVDSESRGVQSV